MSIQALREKRAARAAALQELVKKDKWDPATDQPIYDAGLAEIEEIDAAITRHQKMNQLAADTALKDGIIDAALRHGRDDKSEASKLFEIGRARCRERVR